MQNWIPTGLQFTGLLVSCKIISHLLLPSMDSVLGMFPQPKARHRSNSCFVLLSYWIRPYLSHFALWCDPAGDSTPGATSRRWAASLQRTAIQHPRCFLASGPFSAAALNSSLCPRSFTARGQAARSHPSSHCRTSIRQL